LRLAAERKWDEKTSLFIFLVKIRPAQFVGKMSLFAISVRYIFTNMFDDES